MTDLRSTLAKRVDNTRAQAMWGTYRSLHNGHRVQVKHIVVKPGGKLSLQMHHHRAEHWIIVQGTAKIFCSFQAPKLVRRRAAGH